MTRPGSPHSTGTDLLVLHALRCVGFAGPGRVASATGLPEADVESELIDLAVAGERIADELTTAGTRTVVAEAYDGFLVLNPELLELCTAWQLRSVDGVVTPNDHTDPVHDARVLDRLADLDQRAAVA
jgi:hypothetical protein